MFEQKVHNAKLRQDQLHFRRQAKGGIQITTFLVLLGVCLIVQSEGVAQAYVDPGAGAMLWQLVAAGAAFAGYFVRKLLHQFGVKREDASRNQKERDDGRADR